MLRRSSPDHPFGQHITTGHRFREGMFGFDPVRVSVLTEQSQYRALRVFRLGKVSAFEPSQPEPHGQPAEVAEAGCDGVELVVRPSGSGPDCEPVDGNDERSTYSCAN